MATKKPTPHLFNVVWMIPQPDPRLEIEVSWNAGTWMCSCDTFQRSRQPKGEVCRHILAVQAWTRDPAAWALATRAEIVRRSSDLT